MKNKEYSQLVRIKVVEKSHAESRYNIICQVLNIKALAKLQGFLFEAFKQNTTFSNEKPYVPLSKLSSWWYLVVAALRLGCARPMYNPHRK